MGVLAIWATSGPAERSDLSPPQGARGSAARFCLPAVDVLLCSACRNTAPDGFSSSEHG